MDCWNHSVLTNFDPSNSNETFYVKYFLWIDFGRNWKKNSTSTIPYRSRGSNSCWTPRCKNECRVKCMHIYLFGNSFYYIKKYIMLTLFSGPTSLLPDNVWPKLTLGRLKNSTWTSILVSLYLDLRFHHYIFRQVGMLGEVFAEIICSEVQNDDFPFE